MTTEREAEGDLHEKKAEYDAFIPKWKKAREKWDEWEKRRIDLENDLTDLGITFEELASENNTWHAQRKIDFNPMSDGKMQERVSSKHTDPYDTWRCKVQCPVCKQYAAFLEYKADRNVRVSAVGGEISYHCYDIRGIKGTENVDGFWYCQKCAKVAL